MGESWRARVARVPDWAWLTGIVVASAALRVWLVRAMPAPFVFVDELIYSELAKSVADAGSFAVRGVPTSGYSILYPLLLAPAYALFDALPNAYALAKATNAVAMSLAAVPAWLLARRVAGRGLSLALRRDRRRDPVDGVHGDGRDGDALLPGRAALRLDARAGARASLRRPARGARRRARRGRRDPLAGDRVRRSRRARAVPARAAATRRRGAAPLCAAPRRHGRARPARRRGAARSAAGRSRTSSAPTASSARAATTPGNVLRFWLWHVEELTLYVGVDPGRRARRAALAGARAAARVQAHLAATLALIATSTLVVGAFASRFASDRVQDRYLFFLAPLLVIVLARLGRARRATAPCVPSVVGAVVAVGLVVAFPYDRFVGEPAKSDTFGLLPLWTANAYLARRLVPG